MAQGRRVNRHLEVLKDDSPNVAKAIKRLAGMSVLIGIPSDSEQPHYTDQGTVGTNKRNDGVPINNATLGYIHETGAPAANIHARPFLLPGVRNSRSDWSNYLRQAGKAAFEGKLSIMDRALHAAGTKATSAVKLVITNHIPPDLADSTIRARLRKNPVPAGTVISSSDFTPLIDTSQMYSSISYVIRYKERK